MAVAGTVAACAFVIGVLVHKGLAEAGLWAGVVAGLAAVVGAAAAVWAVAPRRRSEVPLPPELEVPSWVVGRPVELAAVVRALEGGRAGTVGITTGLYGVGGFGKTTLAQMVCADQRVRRRFRGRVYPVTVGRDVRGPAAVAAKVNEVIKLVFDVDAAFADPQLAGARLGSLLNAGPRRLLVLDDVWDDGQLAPFTMGGKKCARLVTTRVPQLLTGRGTAVRVDQMTGEQARALLTAELPPLDEAVVTGLLSATGRWPLLLRLVNKILADYAQVADVQALSAQASVLLGQLAAEGPVAVDEFREDRGLGLDVGQPDQRALAVRATMGASTGLLEGQEAERFAELGIFAEDEIIPFRLVAALWRATAGLGELAAARLCGRLAQLALVSQGSGPDGGIALHDVIRDYLRAGLGEQQLARLNGAFLDAVAAGLPAIDPLNGAEGRPVPVAWWALGPQDRYLHEHLIEHLRDAGRPDDAETVARDLRWVGMRLERFGPAAPAADLATVGTPRAARLRRVLERIAHLLAPTEPAEAVIDVLHSRVADDPDWGPQVTALASTYRRPRLVNLWSLPDLADPALLRVLTGHTGAVSAVVVASDGSWLATASTDGTARVWDPATGRERAVLKDHAGWVRAMVVAPDGSWLATADDDGKIRLWDPATGRQRTMLRGHIGAVREMVVAPDGSWLASASTDGTVRVWDPGTGRQRVMLVGHGAVSTLAVAPDSSWLATASTDGRVRLWDPATGRQRAMLAGHTRVVIALVVAPDGSWLATADDDGTVRVWSPATGRQRAMLKGQTGWVNAVVVAPDGSWLATADDDGAVRVWDPVTGRERTALKGHAGAVRQMAVAPDSSWLATASTDGTVRVWDPAAGRERTMLTGQTGAVIAVAVAPDGSWLATASTDGTVRVWDPAAGRERTMLTGQTGAVNAVAVAPDGSWVATADDDGMVRVWDPDTGRQRAVLAVLGAVIAVVVAPDGSWLVTADNDGTVWMWDPATGHARAGLVGHVGAVNAVAVAPDGSWLATAGADGTVRVWDPATARQRATLTGHTGAVRAVVVAPDGSWLATAGTDGTVRVWDPATGRQRASLKGHTRAVNAVVVAPDGNWLATAGADGTVRVWDPATARQRAMLKGHTGWVRAVVVAPDGSWLATAGTDGTVRVWDPATGRQRAMLKGHTRAVNAVAVAPDGSWLATAGADGTVRVWDPATGRVKALMRVDGSIAACAWLGSNAVAVGGSVGLYLFRFLTGTSADAH